jgi:hypothetical protein
MKKLLIELLIALAILFAVAARSAHAETVIGLSTGNCNTAQTVCTIPNDAGDTIVFTFDNLNVTLVITDAATASTTYTGVMQFGESTTRTNYLVVTPFTVELSPAATLSGNLRKTRSGSGRGGWAWHTHWDFQLLTIY